jgi:hypothetical protein
VIASTFPCCAKKFIQKNSFWFGRVDCLLGSEDETQNMKEDFMGDFSIHANSTVPLTCNQLLPVIT